MAANLGVVTQNRFDLEKFLKAVTTPLPAIARLFIAAEWRLLVDRCSVQWMFPVRIRRAISRALSGSPAEI